MSNKLSKTIDFTELSRTIDSEFFMRQLRRIMEMQIIYDFDLLFEHELNDLDASYRAQRDENMIYGDEPSYQNVADWITE